MLTIAALARGMSLATFIAGILATGLVVALLSSTAAERDRERFEAAARDAQLAIVNRVETSVALLRGAAGLFASFDTAVTAEAFRRYVARLALREQYPGILGIGFSRRLLPGERSFVEREMRAQGYPQFRVWPGEERSELHSIVYLEPLDERNRAAIGYDMYVNETRRAAMAEARDKGVASASAVVELVQEIDARKQPGFLIYLPVYRGGTIPKTLEQRREALLGFAYSPIRAGDFLSSAFNVAPAVALSVYHGTEPAVQTLLYGDRGDDAARFRKIATINVVGQPWTFVFRSRSTTMEAMALPLAIALGGAVLSIILGVLVRRQSQARWEAQQALERERAARSEAERANVMKDEFLATVSHELRTPLSAIVGWTDVLRKGKLSQTEAASAIEVVHRNAKAQTRLIDDLLDMNRILSGKMRLDVGAVDMAPVVAEAIASIRPAAETKDIRLQTMIDTSTVLVRGDPTRLQQIIWNLLSNAVKFTPGGGRVQVALERSGSLVRLTVSDTGEGIEPRFLERIFGRFEQADSSTTRTHGGLGIGLAVVSQLVELHGGTITATSAGPGTGATFVVDLPLMIVHAREQGDAAQRRSSEPNLAGIRVLVVDDEADARDLMRRVLEESGAAVHCAGGAHEALDGLARLRPNVLLSDIGMPGMDGYELMRKARALPQDRGGDVPAAAITAYARDEDRLEALRSGFQTCVVKPVRPEELVAVVAALAKRTPESGAQTDEFVSPPEKG